MKVLCIGNEAAYQLYLEGMYPSHHLYGAIELQNAGYEVTIKQSKRNGIKKAIDHLMFTFSEKPDILYLPFIDINSMFLIYFLKRIHVFNISIVGVMHRTPKTSSKALNIFYRYLLKSIDKYLFLSPLNRQECLNDKFVTEEKSIVINWGGDLPFYDTYINKAQLSENIYISTGKENRDFITLINGFAQTTTSLRIFTNSSHAGRDYKYLSSFTNKFPTIKINIVDNNGDSFASLLKELSIAYCVVVPLLKENINYCVGLSSIADALCFGKPLLVSANPYFPIDVEKEKIGLKINFEDPQAWTDAVNYLNNNPELAQLMGKNARILAETKYNMKNCGEEIIECIANIKSR